MRRLHRGIAVAVALSLLHASALHASVLHASVLHAGVLCAQVMVPNTPAVGLGAHPRSHHEQHLAHDPAEPPAPAARSPAESPVPTAPATHPDSPTHCALMTAGGVMATPAVGADHSAAVVSHAPPQRADSSFAKVQARGATVMGVDQYTSQHVFEDLADGGRILLVRDPKDSAGTATVRAHLREIALQFAGGDFTNPMLVHDREVPGTKVMAARRRRIRYTMRERAGGGEVRISTTDAAARSAIRAFLKFQREDHRAPAHEHVP